MCQDLDISWQRLWDALHHEGRPHGADGRLYVSFTNSGNGTGHRVFTVHTKYYGHGEQPPPEEIVDGEWRQGYQPRLCGHPSEVAQVSALILSNDRNG